MAGFARRDDLEYLLRELCGAEYVHEPLLTPTDELLDRYKKGDGAWDEYERNFLKLMSDRRIEDRLERNLFGVPAALLCSEASPEKCHRRLVVEYLDDTWGNIEVEHL